MSEMVEVLAPEALPRRPYGGRRRLINAVEARIGRTVGAGTYDAGELLLRVGEQVVVETTRGPMLARVSSLVERRVLPVQEIRRVMRRATEADLKQQAQNEELADRTHRLTVQRVHAMQLDMKVVQVEVILDRSKVYLYYASNGRVDFRGLVRELSTKLKQRIEMRQIGVREGAGAIGGIGPCGEVLCCAVFLTRFSSVSVKHAKAQGLPVNPQKIYGMCGRLKCCLVYEEATYKELRQYAPARRSGVLTPDGPGNILDVDALGRVVRVLRHGDVVSNYHIRDLIVLGEALTAEQMAKGITREDEVLARRRRNRGGSAEPSERSARPAAAALADDYLWDAAESGADAQTLLDQSASEGAGDGATDEARRGRRRKKRGRAEGEATPAVIAAKPRSAALPGQRPARPHRVVGGPEGQRPQLPAARRPELGATGVEDGAMDAEAGAEPGAARKRRRRRGGSKGGDGASTSAEASVQPSGASDAAPRTPPRPPGEGDGGAGAAEGDEAQRRRRRRGRRRGGGGGGGGEGGGEGGSPAGDHGGGDS